MLNLESTDLRITYRAALASAELLRRSGDPAKAARVESLARMIARELRRRSAESDTRRLPGITPSDSGPPDRTRADRAPELLHEQARVRA